MKPYSVRYAEGPEPPDVPVCEGLEEPAALAAAGDAADARVVLSETGGHVVAHAALWWCDTPPHTEGPVGTIGGFAAADESSARELLDAAVRFLAENGCRLVIGPMNGNTWRSHRFVIESDGRPPFLFEPRHPAGYADWWRNAGFGELSRYSSSLVGLDGRSTVPAALAGRLERSGVTIRALDPERFEEELRAIHALSLRSFAGNFLYTPLDRDAFVTAYQKVRERVDPELVRVAEMDGRPCGFVFCIADLEAAARGERPALIVKTLAVDPDSRAGGLGSLLVDQAHAAAFAKGFREAIHAFQHDSNSSRRITGRHEGRVFRRYALFAKRP